MKLHAYHDLIPTTSAPRFDSGDGDDAAVLPAKLDIAKGTGEDVADGLNDMVTGQVRVKPLLIP